jgi:hypothetical protein
MATVLTAEGHKDMTAAAIAMATAIAGASQTIDATTICNVVKVGSGNWAYWVVYS